MIKKVLYYDIPGDLTYEEELLAAWGLQSSVQLFRSNPETEDFADAMQRTGAEAAAINFVPIDESVLNRLPDLKILALESIGFDCVDLEAAKRHNVYVTHVPGYCSEEVALHALSLLLCLERRILYWDRNVRNGNWSVTGGFPMHRLTGQKAGLVYFGSIPGKLAPWLKALGMEVLVYAPTKSAEFLAQYGCRKADSLEELLRESDVVSLHCPLIQGVTDHLIGREELKQMKKTAFLINTSRGGVIDETALISALKEGTICGAAVDVLEHEAEGKSELIGLENCIVTPHVGYLSEDSDRECRRRCLKQIIQVLIDREIPDDAL